MDLQDDKIFNVYGSKYFFTDEKLTFVAENATSYLTWPLP